VSELGPGSPTEGRFVGALELGGTHVTSALVSLGARTVDPGTVGRDELDPSAGRDELVRGLIAAAQRLARRDVTGWGVATPGPFDYARGVSRIRGVAKLDGLYGVDLRAELSSALHLRPADVAFLNDADAFLIGEWWAGAAQGHERAMGVTLGTGLGSAFLERGRIIETDPRVPAEGRLDLLSFHGAAVEDTLSRRGLRAAYGADDPDVVEIARRARAGESRANRVLRSFGAALGVFLAPWLERFDPTCLVFGGSIARSWDLWSNEFRAACAPAANMYTCDVAMHLEEAPLLGAAYHAALGT
jgi:glucokinase